MDKAIKIIFVFIAGIAALVALGGFYFDDLLTPQSGLFLSRDRGSSWQKFGSLANGGSMERIGIIKIKNNPKDERILYAGTLRNGVLKSVNGGETWHKLEDKNKVLNPRANVYGVGIDPTRPDYVKKTADRFYLAVYQNDYGRVLKTEDGGLSFREVYISARPQFAVFDVEVDPRRPNVVWAATADGLLLKSADYGESWKLAQEFAVALGGLIIDPSNTERMFLASFNGGIFTSSDGGASWTDESEGLNNFPRSRDIQAAERDPRTGDIYLATGFGLLRSQNGGVDWEAIGAIFPDEALPVLDVAFGSGTGEMYVSASNLIYRTINGGGAWQVRKLGTGKQIRTLWVNPKDPNFVLAGLAGSGWR